MKITARQLNNHQNDVLKNSKNTTSPAIYNQKILHDDIQFTSNIKFAIKGKELICEQADDLIKELDKLFGKGYFQENLLP